MSENQLCKVFLDWVKDGGLAGWIEFYLNERDPEKIDTEKLKEIVQVYEQLKEAFGF